MLIAAERQGLPVSRVLLSSISVMELEHGWHRAHTLETARKHRHFLDEVFASITVEPSRMIPGLGVIEV